MDSRCICTRLIMLPNVSGFKPTHRHYKGGLYEVIIPVATNESDLSPVVIYRDKGYRVWVRPWTEFHGMVNRQRRFEEITC